jgi:hypothetical protein
MIKVRERPVRCWGAGWRRSFEIGKMLLKGDVRGVDHFSLVPIPEHVARAIRVDPKVCTGLGARPKLPTSLPLVIVI